MNTQQMNSVALTQKINARRTSLLAVPLLASLASCGGMSDSSSDQFYGRPNQGRLIGGIEGVHFESQGISADDDGGTEFTDINGTTDVAGLFTFGTSFRQDCQLNSNTGRTECKNVGASHFSPMLFSLCGVWLPQLSPPRTHVAGRMPTYTALDLVEDSTAARNFARIVLMGNVLEGDPAHTGIKLSSALQNGTCRDFNWYTSNIQQDAASFQEVARTDGRAHEWPSDQALDSYLITLQRCAQAGQWRGAHNRTTTSPSSSGLFHAFVDFAGQLEGYLDFSSISALEPFGPEPPVLFAGTVQGQQFSYVGPPTDTLLPNLNVSVRFYPHAALGTWSAENNSGGTTEDTRNGSDDLGMFNLYNVNVPKYRFLAKDIAYRVPGAASWEHYILTIDVSYDSSVRGELSRWPPRRLDQRNFDEEQRLVFDGGLSEKNELAATWWKSGQSFTLHFDPNSNTLTGPIVGEDGIGALVTFTQDEPLRGCRL